MSDLDQQATHRVGAFAIIRDQRGRILVSRRLDGGWYNLPGGGVEPHESVPDALLREVREETGLEVEIGHLVGLYSKPQKREVVLTFEAHVVGGRLRPSDEADLHEWIEPDGLEQRPIMPKHLERIQDALRGEAGAIVKDQRQPTVTSTP